MFVEIRKSLNNILEERISSPFYGSLVISWILWNWQAIYATFFIGQEYIKPLTKIQYVYSLYNKEWYISALYLFIAPIASAILLILYVPKLTNALFEISLKYEKERMVLRENQTASQRLTIEQSAALRNEVSEQVKKYNELISQKDTDIATTREQANQLLKQKMQFAFLYAEYGIANEFVVVTETVQGILFANKKMTVDNVALQIDPAHGKYKRLLIVYSSQGHVNSITAREHEEIEFEGETDVLAVKETEESKKLYETIIDTEVLSSIQSFFPGTWKLAYEGDIEGEEEVQIRNSNQYFYRESPTAEFTHHFDLQHIQVNLNTNKILFYKRGILPKDARNVHSELDIIEAGGKYTGVENFGRIRVTYTRIG